VGSSVPKDKVARMSEVEPTKSIVAMEGPSGADVLDRVVASRVIRQELRRLYKLGRDKQMPL
jgi:hypothetical protein